MPNLQRIFSPPKHAVLSLAVQANMANTHPEKPDPFRVLVRHFLDRFFNNEMVASDDEAKTRLLVVAASIGLPGFIAAIFLMPIYHLPGGRPFWLQISDHYFYAMYSLVAMGAVTVFAWDLFFPDLLDVFILSSLPIPHRTLFLARIAAASIFLGTFLLGANFLGFVFLPAASDLPSPARHFAAHLLAVSASGIFAAALCLALQGLFLAFLGDRLYRKISPFLQGFFIAILATILFLFPLMIRFLPALLRSGNVAVLSFPPFWFLGIYERVLHGPSTLPIFTQMAKTGCWATLGIVALAILVYPVAYRRRTCQLIEGYVTRKAESRARMLIYWFIHAIVVRKPVRRAVYHFVSQTLLRTHRHRAYLAMYSGMGLALVLASAIRFHLGEGHVRLVLAADGLPAVIPIVAFWSVVGLRSAFVSPVDQRARWVFRFIGGRPGYDPLMAAKDWVLLWSTTLTVATGIVIHFMVPATASKWPAIAGQLLIAAGLCLLLTDAFFLRVKTLPFTGGFVPEQSHLISGIVLYFGFFPTLVIASLGVSPWIAGSIGHLICASLFVVAAHLFLKKVHRRFVMEHVSLLDIDEDQEEFPQRLGLRY